MLDNISIGTDIEEIRRFEGKETNFDFLSRVFTTSELEYSLKSKSPAKHLCARFCAKEAIVKALSELAKLSPEKLKEGRYDKFRKMGKFIES